MIAYDRDNQKAAMPDLQTTVTRQPRPTQHSPRGPLAALIMAAYLVSFIALDRATVVFATSPGVSVWYPPPGLSLALLLVFGLRYAPALLVGPLISGFWTYQLPATPTLMIALIITVGYSMAAGVLRHILRIDLQLGCMRDLGWFVLVALTAPLIMGMLGVMGLAATALIPWSDYLSAVLGWWVGDAIGIVILTPFLLVHGVPWARALMQGTISDEAGTERAAGAKWRRPAGRATLEMPAQAVSIVLGLWAAFGLQISNDFHLVYVCFLPLIWVALRHGMPGATAGVLAINVGATLALRFSAFQLSSLAGQQVLMLALSLTGLFLGAVSTERRRAEDELAHRNRQLLALYDRVERDRAEKATLLEELNHRVRNNLAAIVSFLEIEREQVGHRKAEQALMACLARVKAIAKAHELLAAEAFAPVDLQEFIAAALGGVIRAERADSPRIEASIQGVPLKLPPKQFVALACISNELLLNAIKHAFQGRERGRIEITTWEEDKRYILEVRDDGVGYAEEARRTGSGLEIIATLCRADLNGDCVFLQDGGTVARISFPKPVIEAREAR